VHPGEEFDFAPILKRWDESPDLAKWGVSLLVHGLLDYLVDGYFDAVQGLVEAIEDLEGDLFRIRANQDRSEGEPSICARAS
jgi:magnesium transporter